MEQAKQYVACASEHPRNYKTPQVLFLFTAGVTHPVRDALLAASVDTHGELVDPDPDMEQNILQLMDNYIQEESQVEDMQEDNCDHPTGHPHSLARGHSQGQSNGRGPEGVPQAFPLSPSISHDPEHWNIAGTTQEDLLCHNVLNDLAEDEDESIPSAAEYFSSQQETGSDDDLASFFCNEDISTNTRVVKPRREKALIKARESENCDNKGLLNSETCILTNLPVIKKVNLDITTLVCLVSNLCHGSSHWVFEEDILNQQAAAERKSPLLPLLNNFLQGNITLFLPADLYT